MYNSPTRDALAWLELVGEVVGTVLFIGLVLGAGLAIYAVRYA